mgnify:CR=1 FL=1
MTSKVAVPVALVVTSPTDSVVPDGALANDSRMRAPPATHAHGFLLPMDDALVHCAIDLGGRKQLQQLLGGRSRAWRKPQASAAAGSVEGFDLGSGRAHVDDGGGRRPVLEFQRVRDPGLRQGAVRLLQRLLRRAELLNLRDGGSPLGVGREHGPRDRPSPARVGAAGERRDLGAPAAVCRVTLVWEAAYARNFTVRASANAGLRASTPRVT